MSPDKPEQHRSSLELLTGRPLQATRRFETIEQIKTQSIKPNRFQPRSEFRDESLQELAESIKKRGVIQPVLVRRFTPEEVATHDGFEFELIVGERRLRAARMAGLDAVPAIIRQDTLEKDLRALALIENIQREDLSVLDKAHGIQDLKQELGEKELVAKALGVSTRYVERYLKIAEADPVYKEIIKKQQLDFRTSDKLTSVARDLDRLGKESKPYERIMEKIKSSPMTQDFLEDLESRYFSHDKRAPKEASAGGKEPAPWGYWNDEKTFGLKLTVRKGKDLSHKQKLFFAGQAHKFLKELGAKKVAIEF